MKGLKKKKRNEGSDYEAIVDHGGEITLYSIDIAVF